MNRTVVKKSGKYANEFGDPYIRGEAYFIINSSGDKLWCNVQGQIHRTDGPAAEFANGSKHWFFHGQLHREDGPAIEYTNGEKHWYLHGQRHREDGPAIEYTNGEKHWYFHGQRHRTDGPACEWVDGREEWWFYGEQWTDEDNKPIKSLQEVSELIAERMANQAVLKQIKASQLLAAIAKITQNPSYSVLADNAVTLGI